MNANTNSIDKKQTLQNKDSKIEDSMLEEFFVTELKHTYWAEKHLVEALPKMEKAATTQELKNAFAEHLQATKGHVERLDKVFDMLGIKADVEKCAAMAGITDEGEDIISDTEKGTAARDVGLIFAGQKVEHCEIAAYGGLAQLAKTLSHDDIANLLEQTLSEEKEADELLSTIAEKHVNYEAAQEEA